MSLVTEWAGRTGKYVARGQDNTRCASWLRAKYFPVRPYLQPMILNLGHIALIPVFVSYQCCFEMVFWWTCPSSRKRKKRKRKKRSSTTCQRYSLIQVLMSRIVAQSMSILSYDSCLFEFSLTERKLIHGSICLVSHALFLERPYAFFRPYHLTLTTLIRNFFHRVFQRNCARERVI